MLKYSSLSDKAIAIRYPKGSAPVIKGEKDFDSLTWDYIKRGSNGTVVSFGNCIETALQVADEFEYSVVDARTLKPFDEKVLNEISSKPIIIIEDNACVGGLYEGVLNYYSTNKIKADVYGYSLKDEFVNVGSVEQQFMDNSIDAQSIINNLKNEIR